ncbi:hypothetical protein D9757_000549 [Collybiopsis confluens]|uniref:Glutathione hydrolase n=1 Tax=Collybiopsis confluens TaxID=2823264 RepID=A0A8H5I1E4_9AGAR|nr:hypothetical protein D9757_000549 [Collybiopsis confluens]
MRAKGTPGKIKSTFCRRGHRMPAKTVSELPFPAPAPRPRHKSKPVGRISLALLLCFAFLSYRLYSRLGEPSHPRLRNPFYLIEAQNGGVASENVRCSNIGVQTMKDGGNAIDAAIASCLCIGVVNMFSAGIGGGGFLTIRLPPSNSSKSEVFVIDFRETAPSLANATMFPPHSNTSIFGGLAVAVPGELRGLSEAHRRWGRLPWKELVQPAAELAREWKVDVELSRRIPLFPNLMFNNPDWSAIFAPRGALLKQGDVIHRTNLSRTLSIIATEGPEAFYKGPIADSLIRKIRATGGIMTQDDLDNYSVNVYTALEGSYLDKKLYVPGAPTSGPAYHLDEVSGLNAHRLVEALKFGFAARTRISDPAMRNDTTIMDEIHTKEFADLIRKNLTDDRTHSAEYYNPLFDAPEDHGTSHISVVDRDGMAVSLTHTVNTVFASQMDDFSVPGTPNTFGLWPSPFNYPEPGKRPLSSTVPLIIENADGSFYLAAGGSGGSLIFSALLQVLLNLMKGTNALSAVEYGRLHDQLYPPVTLADSTYPDELLDALRQRGHNVTVMDINRVAAVINVVIRQDNGTIHGYPGSLAHRRKWAPNDTTNLFMSTTDSDLISSYAGLLLLASICIYAGSFSSLPNPNKQASEAENDDDDEEEEELAERLSVNDACNKILWEGMDQLVIRLSLVTVARKVVGNEQWKRFERFSIDVKKGRIDKIQDLFALKWRTPSVLLLPLSVLPSALYRYSSASRRSALLTDILSMSFSHNTLSLLKLDSFKTGTTLLSGLFVYDIWWVFGTPVMVTVATTLDVPIKLLWPKSASFSDANGFTMLGLGDVVIPGAFVSLALRYDYHRHLKSGNSGSSFKKPYFYAAFAAYIGGLVTTMTVMHMFKAAQPALLYLSPSCILSFILTAFLRGEFSEAWNWIDEPNAVKKGKQD